MPTQTTPRCPTCYEPDARSHRPVVTIMGEAGRRATLDLDQMMLDGHVATRLSAVAPGLPALARAQAELHLACTVRKLAVERQRRPDYATGPTLSERTAERDVIAARDLLAWLTR